MQDYINNKGFAHFSIVIAVIAVLVLAGGGYLTYQRYISAPNPKACTQEAKLCPDGSYVSRTGPNCEFAECPVLSSDTKSNWKIYKNENYGFEVKYPDNFEVSVFSDQVILKSKDSVRGEYPNLQIDIYEAKSYKSFEEFYNSGGINEFKKDCKSTVFNGTESFLCNPAQAYIPGDHFYFFRKGSVVLIYPATSDIARQILSTFKFIDNLDISDWKTYRNEKYGFEVKYPQDYTIEEDINLISISSPQTEEILGGTSGEISDKINIYPQVTAKFLQEMMLFPEPVRHSEDYYKSDEFNRDIFNKYVGEIEISKRQGFQFSHYEFTETLHTIPLNLDGTFFMVQTVAFLRTEDAQRVVLSPDSIEPYTSISRTLKFFK